MPAMVLQRSEATDEAANVIAAADAVWVVGDSSLHLRSVVKDTPVMDALRSKADDGPARRCRQQRRRAVRPDDRSREAAPTRSGSAVVSKLALITEVETWSPEQLQRSRDLAAEHGDAALVLLPLRTPPSSSTTGAVETVGDVEIVGELSRATSAADVRTAAQPR